MKRFTLLLMAVLALQVQAAVPEPKGAWEFNPPDPNRATIGAPLELVGSVQKVAGIDAADGAIQIGEGSYYVCTHGIGPNGGGAKVNQWTLLIDFSYPPSSRSDPPNGYNDLFQIDPTNADDSDWTINSAGAIGIGAVGYSNAFGYTTSGDTWYRMVLVVENGVRQDLYVDGVEIFKGNQQGVDGRFSLAEVILLFCAGNNQDRDDAPINVSAVAIWDTPLGAGDIFALGQAGDKFFTQKQAWNPLPTDGSEDVPVTTDLAWSSGEYAATHTVYFGSSRQDVDAAAPTTLVAEGLARDVTRVEIERLDFGQTYYWRVDEVNGAPDRTVFPGNVWSFTAEPLAYPIENIVATSNGISDAVATPQKTVDGSGIDADDQASLNSTDMWLANPPADELLYIQFEFDRVYKLHEMLVWNYNVQFELVLGFGVKDVTVTYSENGTDWTPLGDAQLARGTASTTYTANTVVDLGGVPARYVRLTINSGWGVLGQYGLSEVRFMYIPAQPREPQPADGATDIDPATSLSWRAGREAASHEVYLGTDSGDLPLADTVGAADYTPGDLEFGRTYYWQIVEVNDADATPAWPGDVWSFSTLEYAWIDGFETYNDDIDAKTTIFDTWLDGWVNNTGSTVGYLDAPFAERTIVRSGVQSMPLQYDNSASPFYSEAERQFETAQDWTRNGADTLVLYVRGIAAGLVETADGQVIMNAFGTDIWNTTDQFRYAYKSLSGDGSITVRVDSLVRSNEWAKAGVMIRETLDAGSAHAFVAVTPDHGVAFQRRPAAEQASVSTDAAGVAAPYWVKLTRTGNVFTAQHSADGSTWTDLVASPAVQIPMAGNVYVGLAVTSHDAAISTAAEFSNVATSGDVTGAWQTGEVGVAQPQGNSSESMYVTIEDSAGKTATVVNPDAAVTARPTWQEWAIPYSDLSGVNLSRIETMVIGVGSATSPQAGGTGTVYIDDIGYGRPAAQ